MNREDIVRMAQEAGVTAERVRDLINFANLVASAEREKFCVVLRQLHDSYSLASDSNAIRARGYKQDGQCKYCTDGCPACDARKLPEQEPVAVVRWNDIGHISWRTHVMLSDDTPLYTTPPQRTWVGLTDEEVKDIVWNLPYEPSQENIRAIEAKLKEKNNGV